ncbi:AsmA family protein [Sphingobacterium griseoflavum]|uniref:AsmA-like C-terminal domain-containing protein n=1 Tax=Sphingobacterium griseoflavum TaxID=1474952 RepID=A0ABQ3I1T9_9SPHI|nr:hypothetical protein [Sphingobacterium griseoflavum]GHE46344.1 hypothetical protein GCM10017764_31950 [Sphingobacterium griseoflavum]
MKPIWKWVIGVFVFIVLALSVTVWYFSKNWKPIVEEKLQEVIKKSTDSLYTLSYDKLDLNLAVGNVTLENAALVPDTAVYARLEATQQAPDNVYHIRLKSLKIKRFGIIDMLTNKKLTIKSISLQDPAIQLTNKYHAYNDTVASKPKKTLYESVKDVLQSVNVRDIDMENVSFKYAKITDGKSADFAVKDIQISVHDVLIDETSLADTSRLMYTKMVEIIVPGFTYNFANGIYQAKFDELKINTRDQNILLTNVDYKPVMNKAAYFKKKGKNVTMADLHFDTLRMEQLDFRALLDNQQTIAKKVQLKNGHAKLYNDKRYPKSPKNQIGQAPHQKLLRVEQLIDLDSVFVENIDVVYGEMSGKYYREGEISFNKASGVLTHVTNDSMRLAKDKYLKADLRAKVMNSGNLHATFSFDMLSKNGAYSYTGNLKPMQAPSFNRILTPLLNVEIGSGNIRSVRFTMEGNDYRSWGDFRFEYDNLKINLLNDEGDRKKKKMLSFLVNQLIINDSNPDANEVYHVGKVNHKRVPEHTFFKNLWQSLLDGIKQTAGISPEREARLVGSAQSAKKALEETKGSVKKTKGFFNRLFKKGEKDKQE